MTEREQFEAWYLSQYPNEAPRLIWIEGLQKYSNMFARLHFKGWQAAYAAGLAARVPEGWRMVACECLQCLRDRDERTGDWNMPIEFTRMILCATCGNKRCPHATDHRHACTGSNEPGQAGSAYQ